MPSPKVPAEWIRDATDVEAIRQGCWFDAAAGEFVCDFIETFCCPSKGPGAGRPLVLLPWQRDFLMRLFSWKRANGLRRYARAYLEIAKKNGKSMLISAILLFMLMADGESSPQCYLNACDRGQADIVFKEAKMMVEASPDLRGRLKIIDSKADKRIVFADNGGEAMANSANAPAKDGFDPHLIIFDELHRQPGRELVDVFEYAQIARAQPLWIDLTTAGEDDTGVWHEQRERGERNNAGLIQPPDITFLAVIYRALPTDDIDDPATWRKANPSLGHVLTEERFAEGLRKAKESPARLALFKRLRLNIISFETAKFIHPDKWKACGPQTPARRPPSAYRGLTCFLGGDLSSKIDLTALVAVFRGTGATYDVAAWFYLPEDMVEEAEKRDKMPYRRWAELGWLTLTPGITVDYGFLREEVLRIKKDHGIQLFACDDWNATQILGQLQNDDGIHVKTVIQGFKSLSDPTKELEKLIVSRALRHDGNPVLTWCVLNAVAVIDAQKNVKLSKDKSRQKIDGAAALVNAIAGAISKDGQTSSSVYQKRGFLYI